MRKYRSYPDHVKRDIAKTGNLNLYPALKIPRTTALHWVKSAQNLSNHSKPKRLSVNLSKIEAKFKLLNALKKEIYLILNHKKIDLPIQKKVLKEIKSARASLKLKECLELIGLSYSRYKRWSYNIKCKTSIIKVCKKRYPHQLSKYEIDKISELCTARKFKHFPFTALHKLSVKSGWISCSKVTWFKYIKIFNLKRSRKSKAKKMIKNGITTTRKDQIWHIDITEVILKNGKKLYLQVIIDNFSRKIITWSLKSSKSSDITIETLHKVKHLKLKKGLSIMSDKGGENLSSKVKVVLGQHIGQLIARANTKYSNSVVEAFFRSLKYNFLLNHELLDFEFCYKKIKYYINQHNAVIPHSKFKWCTPNQVYRGITDSTIEQRIIKTRIQLKSSTYQKQKYCHFCNS